MTSAGPSHVTMAANIWSVADLLRGDYKRHGYGAVILPFTLLRRLDTTMAPTRDAVRDRAEKFGDVQNKDVLLRKASGLPYYNTSDQDFTSVAGDAGNVANIVADNAERNTDFMKHYFDNPEFRQAIEAARKRAYQILREPAREEALARFRSKMRREIEESGAP